MLVYERVYYTTNTVGENTFPQFLLCSFGMFWPKNIKQTVIALPVFKKKKRPPPIQSSQKTFHACWLLQDVA